jgi:hypothetical protein
MYKKTIVIDSFGDITEEIRRETEEDYTHLANEASVLKETFQDLSKLTGQCYDSLNDVLDHTRHTVDNTQQGTENLVKAATVKAKTTKLVLTTTTIIGGSIGLVVGAVLGSVLHIPGATVGAQIGLVAGCLIGGGTIGTGAGVLSAFAIRK